MTIIAFNHYWVIRWHWLLVNLVVVGILIGLSLWQWQRAQDKTHTLQRLAQWQAAGAVDAAALNSLPVNGVDGMALRFPVRWLAPAVWLLDNRIVNSRVGYDVVVPVIAEGLAQPIMVNLGWVPAAAARSELPAVNIPREFMLDGILRTHRQGLLLGQNIEASGRWPLRIQQMDWASLAQTLPDPILQAHGQLYPGVVYQQLASPFIIHYRPVVMPPEKHRAYSLQWALLAVAVVAVALLASAHKCEQNPQT